MFTRFLSVDCYTIQKTLNHKLFLELGDKHQTVGRLQVRGHQGDVIEVSPPPEFWVREVFSVKSAGQRGSSSVL